MSIDSWPSDDLLAERRPLLGDDPPSAVNPRIRKVFAAAKIERVHVKPLALLLLLAVVFSFWMLWHSRAREIQVALPRATISDQPASGSVVSGTTQSAVVVVVDIGGRVKHPGVYTLPTGSRAIDAVKAAGGALPGTDLTTINQAQRLEDGEQIVVGLEQGSATTGSATHPGKVNLNSASIQDFDALPGIGPVLASRIVTWRKEHGRFKSVEDLRQVSGVGDAKFADLRPLVRT
jgi:competence protein ComEA